MFPLGVLESKYKGNVKFWADIVGGNVDYDHAGFQNIAKGWTTGAFIYDINGYPQVPQEGDVVFDPSKVTAHKFQQYNGGKWISMQVQPSGWTFDFGKYTKRFAPAFMEESEFYSPDIVAIMLGTNDFYGTNGIPGISEWLNNMTTIINSIHNFNPTIKVIIIIPPTGASQDAWGLNYGTGSTSVQFKRNIQLLGRQILNTWDTDTALANNIFVINAGLAVDPDFGYDTTTEPVNKFNTTLVTIFSNGVHPNTSGLKQMGDAIAAIMQGIR